jgi:hypothetical protein
VTVFSTSLTGGDGVALTDEQRRRLTADQAASAVPLTVEARVPVWLRFGKVLRTWTVDIKAACGVVVDRLDAGTPTTVTNRGCRVYWIDLNLDRSNRVRVSLHRSVSALNGGVTTRSVGSGPLPPRL